jgi:hypothetical protein
MLKKANEQFLAVVPMTAKAIKNRPVSIYCQRARLLPIAQNNISRSSGNGDMSGGSGKGDSLKESGAVELRADGWERFRQAVHAAAKSGPKHKVAPKAKESPASKGRKGGGDEKPEGSDD